VGEEAVELAVAALDEPDERVVEEAADLVYHLYVLLAARGLDVTAVDDELRSRRAPRASPTPPPG
jgi:phosphoribosyl-ATP pyrophosphohydrolase